MDGARAWETCGTSWSAGEASILGRFAAGPPSSDAGRLREEASASGASKAPSDVDGNGVAIGAFCTENRR